MRLSTKVMLWAWGVLLIVIASLIYSAYSKLNPDSLVSVMNKEIQKSYPGSKLTISSVDYGFALDFKLTLEDLQLTRGNQTLASARKVQLKVPWWLILLNRGNAHINISQLTIFVTSHDDVSHLPTSRIIPGSKKNLPVELSLPKYLMDAHYTLRAEDIAIKEMNGDRRFFKLSKLLVREFQYGKNSAFELNIPISIIHKDKKYSSDLWLFGDITPDTKNWVLNYRGEFKTKENEGFQFDDLVIHGKSVFNPSSVDIRSQISLSIERDKIGTGEILAKNNQFQIKLNFTHFPLDFLNMVGDEVKNPFLKKIDGTAEGEITYIRVVSNESTSTLTAKLNFPGNFILGDDVKIPGKWKLTVDNEKWHTSFLSQKGEVNFARRAVIDLNNGILGQYSQEIGFSGIELGSALKSIDSLSSVMAASGQPYYSTFISLKNCLENEKNVDGSFRLGISPYEKFYQAELVKGASKFALNFLSKASSHKISAEFVNFDWKDSYNFLDPWFHSSEGNLTGKVDGAWSSHWSDGKWLLKIKGEGLNKASGSFIDLSHEAWKVFGIDAHSVPGRSWSANVSAQTVKISSFTLEGSDPASLSGTLTTAPRGKSSLILNYPKNKKWKPVSKPVVDVFWKKEAYE